MAETATTRPGAPWRVNVAMALLTGLCVFVSAWACIELTRETGRIAAIWLANAVMLAAVLKRPRSDWPLLLAFGYLANILANLVTGDQLAVAVVLSLCNSLEVVLCALLVTGLTAARDFRRPRLMVLLTLVAAGPASIASAALGASILLVLYGTDFTTGFSSWYAADALGLVTLTPMLLLSGSNDLVDLFHPAMRRRLALVSIVLLATLSAVFLQSTMPLLFLAFPAIIVATFSLGFAGASLAVMITAGIALWATLNHMGPISLMHDGLRLQIIALQLFAAALSLTGVAVATLLGERDLLGAALGQSPDFQYVKNLNSEFVSTNLAVAQNAGFTGAKQLIGKSDYDLTTPQRAALLKLEEQEIMAGAKIVTFKQEQVSNAGGEARWFETSKVALTNLTGRVIGLAGTTRDITAHKALEESLEQSRARVELVLTEMSDGLAVISADGYIVLCNEQYRQLFPISGQYRVPGAFLPKIVALSREQGEVQNFNPGHVMDLLKEGGQELVHLFDDTWLEVRVRPAASGGCTLVVSDITRLKRTEMEMRELTKELEVLAGTDALTGLANRRSLDARLAQEIARCKRSRLPISLIMIDVDNFKAFNDHYGHPAGDACLRRVAEALQAGAKRPGDLVTRYGGEEIAVVLPETDEAGAFVLAEQLRLAIRDLAIGHTGSDKGIVTISAGVASLVHDGQASTVAELHSRADEALYRAKDAGRDKVMGWAMTARDRVSKTANAH